ncbi:hypothetical protein DFH09DRAFT_1086717 [Mycena vulgaris]|nr:hypothetical protein DFH09DRAFT_1086717 [Mycena vulgaris]
MAIKTSTVKMGAMEEGRGHNSAKWGEDVKRRHATAVVKSIQIHASHDALACSAAQRAHPARAPRMRGGNRAPGGHDPWRGARDLNRVLRMTAVRHTRCTRPNADKSMFVATGSGWECWERGTSMTWRRSVRGGIGNMVRSQVPRYGWQSAAPPEQQGRRLWNGGELKECWIRNRPKRAQTCHIQARRAVSRRDRFRQIDRDRHKLDTVTLREARLEIVATRCAVVLLQCYNPQLPQ